MPSSSYTTSVLSVVAAILINLRLSFAARPCHPTRHTNATRTQTLHAPDQAARVDGPEIACRHAPRAPVRRLRARVGRSRVADARAPAGMLAARLARAPSGHASAFGGRRSLLARRARLERAQEPADRARRRPARARRGGRGRRSWRRATRSGSSATASVVDAREFERLVREGRLEEAVDLCDGELLPGLDAEWVYEAREAHRRRFGDVLERLAADAEAAGALKDAIRISRRRVELDPLREDAHRELIRRLIAAGEVAAARVAFDEPRTPPADRAARARPRERPVACSRPFTRTRATPRRRRPSRCRRFPRRWRGESAARSSAARTRSAGFGPSGPMLGTGRAGSR